MFRIYSIKTKLFAAIITIAVLFILIFISNFVFIYKKFLTHEKEKINIYTNFILNDLESSISQILSNLNTQDFKDVDNKEQFYQTLFENFIEPDYYEWQLLITDERGNLLYHTHKPIDYLQLENYSSYPSIKSALLGNWGLNMVKIEGTYFYTSSKFIPILNWLIVIQIPFINILKNVLNTIIPNMLLILINLAFLITIALFWANRFMYPLTELTRSLKAYAIDGSYVKIDKFKLKLHDKNDEISHTIDSFNKMIEEKKHLENQLMEIDENEKRKISNELYFEVNQYIGDLSLRMQIIEKEIEKFNEELFIYSYLKESINLINILKNKIRNINVRLYPVKLYKDNIVKALEELVINMQDTYQTKIIFFAGDNIYIKNKLISINLYRIIFEALENACKYSKSDKIDLSIIKEKLKIIVTIQDYGKGFNYLKVNENGIKIMKYRTKLIDGELDIISSENNGTAIRCTLDILKM